MASNLKASILIKYLVAKNGPITTQTLVEKYLTTYPVLKSRSHLKSRILNEIWKKGDLVKRYVADVPNPVTKKGTWFWEIKPEFLEVYKSIDESQVESLEQPPEMFIKPRDNVPLLGRTGPFSKFAKSGSFSNIKVQRQ